LEKLHQRQMFGLLTNLQHTVKTGIPHHRDTADTYLRQIAFGAFILHKQMVEVAQHMSVRTAIPLEEYLSAAENGRNAVHRNTALVQFVQIVLPELVLDEECHAGIHDIQELLHIAGLVERQVTDNVCPPIILADLIARRREESQQNTVIRIFGTNFLNQRPSLLELPQRSGMEPYIAHVLLQLLPEKFIDHPVSLHHLSGLTAKWSSQMHQNIVEGYRQVI